MVGSGLYSCVLGSRILGGGALAGGMPLWQVRRQSRSSRSPATSCSARSSRSIHTGYRAFSRELLEALPLDANSDDFVFDNQMLAQAVWMGFQIGEVSCPTRYAPDASSINFARSVKYGFGCLNTAMQFRLAKMGGVSIGPIPRRSRG